MPRLAVNQLAGLIPAVNRQELEKPRVVDGRNFIMDVKGPKTAFAYQEMYHKFETYEYVESFEMGDSIYYVCHSKTDPTVHIQILNWPDKQFEYLFELPFNLTFAGYKTSYALVGGLEYLCNPGFGVLEFDRSTKIWTDVTSSFPATTFAIASAAGRCAALSQGLASWSAIDDATDFVPSTTTGAGSQSLSLVGQPVDNSEYIGVYETHYGFMTVTKQGIIKSTAIDSSLVFNHRPLAASFIPLNQNCVVELTKHSYLFLTELGFFTTDGLKMEPWQPLMSEHLKDAVFPQIKQSSFGRVALFYADHLQWFFISLGASEDLGRYESAYVLYLPKDEWGSFNQTHRAFIQIDSLGNMETHDIGYVGATGEVRQFEISTLSLAMKALPDSSVADLQNEVFYSDPVIDYTGFYLGTSARLSTSMRIESNEHSHLTLRTLNKAFPSYPGFYEVNGLKSVSALEFEPDVYDPEVVLDGDTNIVASRFHFHKSELLYYGYLKQALESLSLNGRLLIGGFRLTDNQAIDQIVEITGTAVSMPASGDESIPKIDWLLDFQTDVIDDWLNSYPVETFEDWGYNLASVANCEVRVLGTLDGYSVWDGNDGLCDEVYRSGNTRVFSTRSQGLYVFVEFIGDSVNDYIHMEHLELQGSLAGRL